MTPRRLSLGAAAESSFPLVSRVEIISCACLLMSYRPLAAGFLNARERWKPLREAVLASVRH